MNRNQRRKLNAIVSRLRPSYFNYTSATFGELPETGNQNEKCYARSLNSCSGNISREHYISENILEHFAGIQPAGIPWMNHRSDLVGPNDLTVKCLCEKHNNYLSPLDIVGGGVFKAFHEFGTYHPTVTTASGELFERWCLKVLFGILASKKVKIGETVIGTEVLGDEWLRVLFFGHQMPEERGLYCFPNVGQQIQVATKVGVQTLLINNQLQGIKLNIAGFEFYFTLCERNVGFNQHHPGIHNLLHRPTSINKGKYPQAINFKWS